MFDRIKAKEKSKTLLRTRSFLDGLGLYMIQIIATTIKVLLVISVITVINTVISLIVMAGVYAATASKLRPALGILGSFPGFLGSASAVLGTVSTIVLSSLLVSILVCIGLGALQLLYHAGMTRSALRMNRGDKNVRIIDIILAGDRLGKYIAIAFWQALFLFLWNLPSAAMTWIASLVITKGGGSSLSLVFGIIMIIAAYVWSVYITIDKICQYYFAYCVAEDDRELAALDCVRESSSLMVDHKWELFVTMLSFLGWDIISVLPLGNIFVQPYKYLTYASVYEQLSGGFKPVSHDQMLWFHNAPIRQKEEKISGERFVEILSGEFEGSSFPVKSGEEITIGRDPKRSNIVTSPANTLISGLHCRIRYDGQNSRYIVTDHSVNGTFLNNEKLVHEKGTYAVRGSLVKLADGAMILRLS